MFLCQYLTLILVSSLQTLADLPEILRDFQTSSNFVSLLSNGQIIHQGSHLFLNSTFHKEMKDQLHGAYLLPTKDIFFMITKDGFIYQLQGNPMLNFQCKFSLFNESELDRYNVHYLGIAGSTENKMISAQSRENRVTIQITYIEPNCNPAFRVKMEPKNYSKCIGIIDDSFDLSKDSIYFYVIWQNVERVLKIGRVCNSDKTFSSYTDVILTCGSYESGSAVAHDTTNTNPAITRLFLAWQSRGKIGLCFYYKSQIVQAIDRARQECGLPSQDSSKVWSSINSGSMKVDCQQENFVNCQLESITNDRVFSRLLVSGKLIMEEKSASGVSQVLRVWKSSPFSWNTIFLLGEKIIMASLLDQGARISIGKKKIISPISNTNQAFTLDLRSFIIRWFENDSLPLIHCPWLTMIDCISYGSAYKCQWCQSSCNFKKNCSQPVNSDVLVESMTPLRIHSNNSDLFIKLTRPMGHRLTGKHVTTTNIECRDPQFVNSSFIKCKTFTTFEFKFGRRILLRVNITLDYALESLLSRPFELLMIDPWLNEITPPYIFTDHIGWIDINVTVGHEDERDVSFLFNRRNACQKTSMITRGHYKCLLSIKSQGLDKIVLHLKIPAGIFNNHNLTIYSKPNLTLIGKPTFPEARIAFNIKASSLSGFFEPKVGAETSNPPEGVKFETCTNIEDNKMKCTSPKILPIQAPQEVTLVLLSHGTVVSGYPELKLKYFPSPILTRADYKTEDNLIMLNLEGFDTSYRLQIHLRNSDLQSRIDCQDAALYGASIIRCRPRAELNRVAGWFVIVEIGSWQGVSQEVTFDGVLLKRPVNLFLLSIIVIVGLVILFLLFIALSYFLYKYLRFGSATFNNYIEGTAITAYATMKKRAKSLTSRAYSLSKSKSLTSLKQSGGVSSLGPLASKDVPKKSESKLRVPRVRSKTGVFTLQSSSTGQMKEPGKMKK